MNRFCWRIISSPAGERNPWKISRACSGQTSQPGTGATIASMYAMPRTLSG